MADVMMIESDDESFKFCNEASDSDFDEENIAPNVKKSKATKASKAKKAPAKKPAKKKAAPKKKKKEVAQSPMPEDDVLMDSDDEVVNRRESIVDGNGKTVEETYQKKTQLEHILLRPDTYIGSVEAITQPMNVFDPDTSKIISKTITYTPGLFKIFDEIVVNAADNKQRDPKMNLMEINIVPEENLVSVKNNGKGIPVVIHKEHKCYVPTMIFGHLLTGSNFDDGEKKTTGGRNGYGAKLANIFSTKFIVECLDAKGKKKLTQVFRDNMGVAEEPVVCTATKSEIKGGDYTKISFHPDLARFGMEKLDDDIVGLMSKRAYDIAGSMSNRDGPRLGVKLNGSPLPIKSFKDYLSLYTAVNAPVAYESNGRWEVGVSSSKDSSFSQISFVNAISTSKGGGHVTYVTDQITAKLVQVIKRKNKGGTEVKPAQIKNHLCIFVNCLIENPAFDSQTKEFLTTRPKSFGSEMTISDKFLSSISKGEIVDNIMAFAKFRANLALKKSGSGSKRSKLTGIAKLDDANCAGTAKSKDCTLIITEGDSAKSLAMSGLSVVGRDYYGCFPLKGKPLNVRDATHAQIINNAEIKSIVDILGLKFNVHYTPENIKTLRYGHLMIMADQDHDGSHIKGLVINLIHNFWPGLLDIPGFLQQFITPIVKVTKGKKSQTFFTLPEYETWKESTGNEGKGWKIKYYKGLGTSTAVEAKEYFSNLDLHEVHFTELKDDVLSNRVPSPSVVVRREDGDDDVDMEFGNPDEVVVPDIATSGSGLIDMVFSKKKVEDRKTWLNAMAKDTFLNYATCKEEGGVKYSDFINKELILFSTADNARSIPHILDGFKPSQRKVLFACFKRKLKVEIKVAQLAGYVSEHAAYHHGEMSLTGTIIGMAQNFVGSNNINLLTPSGQFGTRRMGGKDAASPRYVFTKLENITRTIFHPDDDALLNYLNDDGLSIEPDYYLPVIPLALVNGGDGIGTGWSSNIPNYNPREIIANLRSMIEGEEPSIRMRPFYCGFNGGIDPDPSKPGCYSVTGTIERTSETTLYITELPLKKWTQDYKGFLEELLTGTTSKTGKKVEACITDFRENHTDTTVSFTITAAKEQIDGFEREAGGGLMKKFKLTGNINTTNMNLFDMHGRIYKYANAEQIMKVFFDERLSLYIKRKEYLLKIMRREEKMLSNKARFVEEVCEGTLIVSNRKRKELLRDLVDRDYDMFDGKEQKKNNSDDSDNEDDSVADDSPSDAKLAKGYEYLLGMKIWSLTFEKAEQLRAQLQEKQRQVEELEITPVTSIWKNDLDALEEALGERDIEMEAAAEDERKAQNKNAKRNIKKAAAKKKNSKKKKKKKKGEWDSDMDDEEDVEMDLPDDDDDDFEAMVVKKPKAAAKRKPKPKKVEARPDPAPSSNNNSDIMEISDQMKRRLSVSPMKPPLSVAIPKQEDEQFEPVAVLSSNGTSSTTSTTSDISSPSRVKGKKRLSPKTPTKIEEDGWTANDRISSDLEDSDEESVKPKKKAVAKKLGKSKAVKKPAAKRAKATKAAPVKKVTKAKPVVKKAPKKKVVEEIYDSLSEASFKSEDESEDDVVIQNVAPRSRRGRAAATKQVVYAVDSDSEVDVPSDDESDF